MRYSDAHFDVAPLRGPLRLQRLEPTPYISTAENRIKHEGPERGPGGWIHAMGSGFPTRDGFRCRSEQLGHLARRHSDRLTHETEGLSVGWTVLGQVLSDPTLELSEH